jgi:hypothetical protein
MMTKKHLQDCRTGKDFMQYAQAKGAKTEFGKGDHCKIYGPHGQTVVPVVHELGKGLRHKVIKQLILIGIPVSLFFLFVIPLIGGM